MADEGWALTSLLDCFAALPPVELKGMALLRECRPGGFFPTGISRETIVEAVTEIAAFTARCQYAASQLAKLAPVPLLEVPILEYGL